MNFRLAKPIGLAVLVLLPCTAFSQLRPAVAGKGSGRSSAAAKRDAAALGARSAEACFDRGLEYLDGEEWKRAVTEFNEAIRLKPNDADAYYNRGVAWQGLKDYAKAVADYTSAIRIDPDDPDALYNRAECWVELKDSQSALTDLTATLRLEPEAIDALSLRGWLREQARQYREALLDYRQAARLEPDSADALNNLAWLLAAAPQDDLRDGPRALTAATRAVELEQAGNWDSLDTLAVACAETGKFPEAVRIATQALKLAPKGERPAIEARLKLFQDQKPFRLPQ